MPSPKPTFTKISVVPCALPGCGREFIKAHLCGGRQRYCSRRCADIARASQKEHPVRQVEGTTPRVCLRCGQVFPSWGPGNRRCRSCREEVHTLERTTRCDAGEWVA